MARWPFGARDTCKSCKSIDVRRWHREDRLYAGQDFSWSWTCGSEPSSTIRVRTEQDAVVLIYRARSLLAAEWKAIEQRVRITWTNCHFGGRRPSVGHYKGLGYRPIGTSQKYARRFANPVGNHRPVLQLVLIGHRRRWPTVSPPAGLSCGNWAPFGVLFLFGRAMIVARRKVAWSR